MRDYGYEHTLAFGWIRGDNASIQYNDNSTKVICFSGSFLHYKLV